ncbi:hypothetical protein NMG60_11020377 [Bertholletia excelsa]
MARGVLYWPGKGCSCNHDKESDEENIDDIDNNSVGSSSVAFCLFLKQAPFHVLLPGILSIDGPFLLVAPKLQDLLHAKVSEGTGDNFIICVCQLLFWFHQIQLSYRVKPLPELEELSGTCFILIERMLAQLSSEQLDSGQVIIQASLLTRYFLEAIEFILCHPVVMLSLEYPLDSNEDKFVKGIFEGSLEKFLFLARQGIHQMDHHVLDLLAAISEHILTLCNGQSTLVEVKYANKYLLKPIKMLAEKLIQIFRDKFDQCIKTEDLKPLFPTLYALHNLIRFMSPFELLKLVDWMLTRIDISDSMLRVLTKHSALTAGFWIAGCAFDMLSAYLQQLHPKGISYNIFWGMEEKNFDILLFESIYFQLVNIAVQFDLHDADLCLLKALNIARIHKSVQNEGLPVGMDISRVILNTPMNVLSNFIHKISVPRAKILLILTEVSTFHLSVFGHLFSDMMNRHLLFKSDVNKRTDNNALSDDKFLMLLPTALTYLSSTFRKYGKHIHECIRNVLSFYSRILLRCFSDWKSYVTGDIFAIECTESLPTSMEELFGVVSDSLLGKSILMLSYHFALNKDDVKLKKRLKLFNSVCPHSGEQADLLDCNISEIGTYSLNQSLNLVNRVVAKVYFCKMLLFSKNNHLQSEPEEDKVGSNKEDLSRIRFMDILVQTWQMIVKKFPSKSKGPGKVLGGNYMFGFLEAFMLRNILELTTEMHNYLLKLNSIPFIEHLARISLLHRFEDPVTLKMLRGVLTSLSDCKSHILVLQLLLAHSQFAPTILSFSKLSSCQFGVIFKPMSSILRLLAFPCADKISLDGQQSPEEASALCMKRLEVVKLLRTLFHSKPQQNNFDFEKDIGVNPKELLFLLLSSYGATLGELDLEIYNLMLEIEYATKSNNGSIAEMDYLWGAAVIKIRKEQEKEQDVLSDKINDVEAVDEYRRNLFRENLPIDPKMCAATVLHFPYDRTVGEGSLSFNYNQHRESEDIFEMPHANAEKVQKYDPVFILRFSIHSLLMGYIEPMEFASLGLLAIAFVSISSPDDEVRKLGYEALGRFKTALEKCQKRKGTLRLRLLLMYLQNGIEEPWQRIPSIIAMFVAEASFILLDSSHDHYSTISKYLMRSASVNMKGIPLFQNFLWSNSVNYKTDRLWILRLLYAGLNSDEDAQIYIRSNTIELLLGFYASPLSDNESKEVILQVVKKSVKLHRMMRYVVEHCGVLLWLSPIVSDICSKQNQSQRDFPLTLLMTVLEILNDVMSSRHMTEWLQKYALEQLSGLATHLYKLLVGGDQIKEKASLVNSILQILTATFKISQKRKVYQPHFTLSLEGLFQIYEVVSMCSKRNYSPTAKLGLKAVLMSTPPVGILCMDQEKLLKFLSWAISTALQLDSAELLHSREAYCNATVPLEEEQSEDSVMSKLLRWLTASVIVGRLSWRSNYSDSTFVIERSHLETLNALLEQCKGGCGRDQPNSGCEETLSAAIFYLQQLLGLESRLLPSVVSALSLLLFPDPSHLAEMDCSVSDGNGVTSLCSRIRCPVEANPAWRWSFYQPWKDLSSKSLESVKMDELHACQSLLLTIANIIGKRKPLKSQFLSPQDVEHYGVFKWERSIIETK